MTSGWARRGSGSRIVKTCIWFHGFQMFYSHPSTCLYTCSSSDRRVHSWGCPLLSMRRRAARAQMPAYRR
eukprot:617557-Hanusia_phi.AAC.1